MPASPAARPAEPDNAQVARVRLQAARARVIMDIAPYLAPALSAMVMHEVVGLGTAATDSRWRLYYDPEVVAQRTTGQGAATWLRGVQHCLFAVAQRFEMLGDPNGRWPLFALAADALISEDLCAMTEAVGDSEVLAMDEPAVHLHDLPVAGATADQVYWRLVEHVRGGGTVLPGTVGVADATRWWELPVDDGSDGSVGAVRGRLIADDAADAVVGHMARRGSVPVPVGLQRWANEVVIASGGRAGGLDWQAAVDLPDPEQALSDPKEFVVPKSSYEVYAVVQSLLAAYQQRPDVDRWVALGHLLHAVAAAGSVDIATVAARVWAGDTKHSSQGSGMIETNALMAFHPILQEMGFMGAPSRRRLRHGAAQPHPGTRVRTGPAPSVRTVPTTNGGA